MRKLLREPLLHFALLGAALFYLYAKLNGGMGEAPDRILINSEHLRALSMQFERIWQRPPNAVELKELIEARVREEVLYREGLALGLDQDDPVVRGRVRQKMEFLADGAAVPAPDVSELRRWFESNEQRYAESAKLSLHQVFVSRSSPAGTAHSHDQRVAQVGAQLQTAPESFSELGDSTLLPRVLPSHRLEDISAVFGEMFSKALVDLPVGIWSGPIISDFGSHWVRIDQREPGRQPLFE